MEQQILTQSEKISLGTKEISKILRTQLKKEFPKCKFSVVTDSCNSISINLIQSNFNVFIPVEDINEFYVFGDYTLQQLKKFQNSCIERGNAQLNQYTLKERYDIRGCWNRAFITEKAHNMLKRVVELQDKYNWDNSNMMTDYFDVNFYFHIGIGKWDKHIVITG